MTQHDNVLNSQLGGVLHQALVDLRLMRFAGGPQRLYCESDLTFAATQPNEDRRRYRVARIAQFVHEAAIKIETEAASLVRGVLIDPQMAERMSAEAAKMAEAALSGAPRYRTYLDVLEPEEVGNHCVKLQLLFAVVGTSSGQPRARSFLYYSLNSQAWSRNPGPSQALEYRKLLDSLDSASQSYFML